LIPMVRPAAGSERKAKNSLIRSLSGFKPLTHPRHPLFRVQDSSAIFCRRRHQPRRPKSPGLRREESSAEQTRLEFSYRSQFHSTVSNLCRLQPARYITTAHSSLCSETMCGAEERRLCFRCLRSPGPPRTPRRVGTLRDANRIQIERYNLATDQLVMTHYFPHAFLCAP
jgi:hypothetical protein